MECFDSYCHYTYCWYVEEEEGQNKERTQCEKRDEENKGKKWRDKKKKAPPQVDWTEELSHDLNIQGDRICSHSRDSFPPKTCSFSSVRGMHQWSIVSVLWLWFAASRQMGLLGSHCWMIGKVLKYILITELKTDNLKTFMKVACCLLSLPNEYNI